jgi:hypothetical protein
MAKFTYFRAVDIPIYRTYLFIAVGLTDTQLEEKLNDYVADKDYIANLVKDSHVDSGYQAMTAFCEGYNIVRFNTLPDVQDINMIAHESFHVTCSIMNHVDVTLSDDSEEAFAYLLGFIVEQFEPLLDK